MASFSGPPPLHWFATLGAIAALVWKREMRRNLGTLTIAALAAGLLMAVFGVFVVDWSYVIRSEHVMTEHGATEEYWQAWRIHPVALSGALVIGGGGMALVGAWAAAQMPRRLPWVGVAAPLLMLPLMFAFDPGRDNQPLIVFWFASLAWAAFSLPEALDRWLANRADQ